MHPTRRPRTDARVTFSERRGESSLPKVAAGDRVQEQLEYLATHDVLTGLPNRALFLERVATVLAQADGQTHVVLFIDLDHFKAVNDRLGHRVGDALLVAVGNRLQTRLRPSDIAARFGGDEFVILVEGCDPHDGLDLAERLLNALRQPFTVEQHTVVITASIGVAVRTPLHNWPTEILREADIALYQAKRAGRARAVLFDATMTVRTAERLELEHDLAQAVERNELYLEYQPEVDLRTKAITGVEALVRWRHPRLGLIGPAEVIPLAEDTGLILPIGKWILEEACRQAHSWQSMQTAGPVRVSVNVSAGQFNQSGLIDDVVRALRTSELAPGTLQLEITESLLMQYVETNQRTVEALRALGVRLAIDDFGTGYSSLAYLRQFPVDVLKLDRSFVQELGTDPRTGAIVQAIITLAHVLEMSVTAEGIETNVQGNCLRAMGCDRGQGYYFGKPAPGSTLTEILRTQTR